VPSKPNIDYTAEERKELFHEDFGNGIDGARTFEHILIALGSFLAKMGGQAAADDAMSSYLRREYAVELTTASDWHTFVEEKWSDYYSEGELGPVMHDLLAYAEYGIVLHASADRDELAKHVETMIKTVSEFWLSLPVKQWQLEEHDEIEPLLNWAKGRWALDHDEPVEPFALAKLANMSESSVRNLMSKKENGLRSVKGKVPASEALEWLKTKSKFWNSIWQVQNLADEFLAPGEIDESYVFVPVSRDGSVFHPGLKGNSGFRVGSKDAEFDFEEFEKALNHLQSMPKPYWRRQNSNGAWVLIAGLHFERLTQSELSKYAIDPTRRLSAHR
jgi:hypothetical protein